MKRHTCEVDALHEALAIYQGPRGARDCLEALGALLLDARRSGLPVMEIAFKASDRARAERARDPETERP